MTTWRDSWVRVLCCLLLRERLRVSMLTPESLLERLHSWLRVLYSLLLRKSMMATWRDSWVRVLCCLLLRERLRVNMLTPESLLQRLHRLMGRSKYLLRGIVVVTCYWLWYHRLLLAQI